MKLDSDACYAALLSGDVRFDGRFYVGVSSTGIYCRTICTARTPKRENCTFYPSAAAAERAGYRPCLRCRPELAPGCARVDAADRHAALALSRIEDGALTDSTTTELAAEIGITDRHLWRIVRQAYGVSPVQAAQTHRLLLAKRLLTDTNLPISEIAFASGFSSLRRFNALFLERYRLNPTEIRRSGDSAGSERPLIFNLPFREPYDWVSLRDFLISRASTGVEALDGEMYVRTVRVLKQTGWVRVSRIDDRAALRVEISTSLAPVVLNVVARLKRQFDLDADPIHIAQRLGQLAERNTGLRLPGSFDGFEMAVRAILGQQVSVKAATTLAGRFSAAFGEPISTPYARLTHFTPSANTVAGAAIEQIQALGITCARARTILGLAEAIASGRINLDHGADPGDVTRELVKLPGIGEWTAQYIAMRGLSWPDAFPHTDLGIMKALDTKDPKAILAAGEEWRPWRSYATMHLWKSLEDQI